MAELTLVNGNVITLDASRPRAGSVTLRGDRIVALDGKPAGEVIDLQGRTVLPGFIDSHVHFLSTGCAHFLVRLEEVGSLAAALERLREAAASGAEAEWLLAVGLDDEHLDSRRLPTMEELDRVSPSRPLFVGHRTGHSSAVNGLAFRRLGLDPGDPGVQRAADGRPTGLLAAQANTRAGQAVRTRFARSIGYREAYRAAAREALSVGLTTIHALDGIDPQGDEGIAELLAFAGETPLGIVVYYQTTRPVGATAFGQPRIGGCGKCIVDGDFGPHTAALLEPYADRDTRGTLYFSDEELHRFFREAHTEGLQIAVHCVGDGAVEQALSTFERVLAQRPRPDHRHRIEHAELITPSQLERARAAGLCLSIQPAFNHFWPHDGEYPGQLGEERSLRVDPVRSLLEAGLPVGAGSDSTVTPLGPLLGIHSAVNHSNPAERITVRQALGLFTTGSAYLAFEEEQKGSLAPGKRADLVVLGEDPLRVPPQALKDVPVAMTIAAGEVAYVAAGHL